MDNRKTAAHLKDAQFAASECAKKAGGIGELLLLTMESGNRPERCLASITAAAFSLADDLEALEQLISATMGKECAKG